MQSIRWAGAVAATAMLAALVACGGDATGPQAPDINGSWQLTGTINNASLGITCQAAGDVAINQSGATFTGQVSNSQEVCSDGTNTTSGTIDGPITGGQISGTTATYSDGECTYTGTVSGTPANRIAGAVHCSVSVQGQTYPFDGTWQVSR